MPTRSIGSFSSFSINIGNNTAEACIFRLHGVRHVNTLCLSWHKVIKPSEKPMEHRRMVRNPRLWGKAQDSLNWQQKDVLKKQPERLYMFIHFIHILFISIYTCVYNIYMLYTHLEIWCACVCVCVCVCVMCIGICCPCEYLKRLGRFITIL